MKSPFYNANFLFPTNKNVKLITKTYTKLVFLGVNLGFIHSAEGV